MSKNNLKILRKQRKLSQRELAALVNISQSMISNLERGATRLDVETVTMFAKFYGVTIGEIIGIEVKTFLPINDNTILNLPQPVKDKILLKLIKENSGNK